MAFIFCILIMISAVMGYYMKKESVMEKEVKAEIEKYNKYAAFYNQSNPAILGDLVSIILILLLKTEKN